MLRRHPGREAIGYAEVRHFSSHGGGIWQLVRAVPLCINN